MGERMELSVVIPVFNESGNLDELIERCLAACRATGKTFEIILVDDGSSDSSPEKIEQAAQASGGAGGWRLSEPELRSACGDHGRFR